MSPLGRRTRTSTSPFQFPILNPKSSPQIHVVTLGGKKIPEIDIDGVIWVFTGKKTVRRIDAIVHKRGRRRGDRIDVMARVFPVLSVVNSPYSSPISYESPNPYT